MTDSQDVNTLRRRGRRRLVGAIALVLLAAIILPMVFDPEPKSSAPPVSVRIPGEDDSRFSPKAAGAPREADSAAPAPAEQKPAAAPAPEPAKAPAPEQKTAATPAPPETAGTSAKRAAPPAPKPAETAAAPQPAATVNGAPAEQFVIPVAALASQAKIRELLGKLKGARLPYYTEPLATAKGSVTRIRVGPYATREAAEEAQRKVERLGLKPGKVLAKS